MKAVIIGGGIIGLSSAYYLCQQGWKVDLIDKSDLSDNCSHGNLGMIVPSHFVPMAAPGIVAQGIRWMFDSKSPFYVKPSLSPSLINWGIRFIRNANAGHVARSAPHLANIHLLSKQLYQELSTTAGFDFAFEKKGIIMYYKTEKVAQEEIHLAEKAQQLGLDAAILSQKEAQALEPHVELNVLGGVHYRCDAHIYPNKLNTQLVQYLKSAGVRFITGNPVQKINYKHNTISSVAVNDEEITGDLFIAAAGAWMPELLKLAGMQLPMMPGKGYTFIEHNPPNQLQVPAILCEARVAITPMENQIRFGGTMEIGPINDRINLNRVQGIVNAVPDYMPGVKLKMPEKPNIWFGFRPCSPDGMPYIGFGKKFSNLLIAGGHGMMGLSLGLATGKLMAESAIGGSTSIDIKAFNPGRFD